MLKLFYAPGSCALASHIALEEAGAKYEAVRVDLRAKDQRKPEYLAINPKGRVPALVTDKAFRRRGWRRWTTLLPLRESRPSTAISAPPCTSPMPI